MVYRVIIKVPQVRLIDISKQNVVDMDPMKSHRNGQP